MLKFQAVAEKTAKNFRGYIFCRTLYKPKMDKSHSTVTPVVSNECKNIAVVGRCYKVK